jgi:ABC-type nitrate/sulfonate/bicarbonate transport system substrate-binding protein
MLGKAVRSCAVAALASAALLIGAPAQAQTKVTIVTFAGATNLPIWIALERGLFAKEGLAVTQEITRGSNPAMQGLMDGKYQFASTALDNTIAIAEGLGDIKFDNFDAVGILGVHSGMNKIVSRPEIKSYADIKGKVIASDALTSGYGLVLVKILASHGLVANRDFTALAVGSTPNRIAAMREGKAVAAVIAPPEHFGLLKEGYNLLADATEAIGSYQGSAFIVRRSWAKANEATVLAFLRAQIAATDLAFADRAGAIAVMKKHINNVSDADIEATYAEMVTSRGGLNRRGAMNMDGVRTLLALRNELAGSGRQLNEPNRYVDLSYYQKALSGMSSRERGPERNE